MKFKPIFTCILIFATGIVCQSLIYAKSNFETNNNSLKKTATNWFTKNKQSKSVLGSWDLTITVDPQPPTPNRVTFSGNESSGTFVDKNSHTGTWKLDGDKLTWDYTSVPNLKNTFVGTLNADWTEISGTNSGTWQGSEFNGTFTGKIVKEKSETEKWREDLQFLAAELPKRHKNAFHTMTREQFANAVKDLDEKIPNLSPNQIGMEFARLVAMVGDGHTRLIPMIEPNLKFRAFPVKFYVFKEGIFIQSANKIYAAAVGGKVLRIGNEPIEQVIAKLSKYIPKENEMGVKNAVPLYLMSPEVLQALGFIKDSEKVSFTLEKDKKTFNIELQPIGYMSEMINHLIGENWVDARNTDSALTPLWLKSQREGYFGESGGYRVEYLKDEKVLYVQLNQVSDTQKKTLAQFFQEVVGFAKNNDLEKLVLDVRQNGGGSNNLVPIIIRSIIQLEKIDQKGKFFVIIGRQTFSAAQNLVNSLEKYTNAIFVGEPTASHINMYGDARRFTLPNSKITVRASSLWHQDNNELDKRQWTAPNIAADLTFADYSNNIDTAMQAILNYKPQKSLLEIAMELFQGNDLKSFRAKAIEYKNNPINFYQNIETEINIFGYRLLGLQKIDEAIEMFKLNAELYPGSPNAFDSYGEALANAGKREEAIKAYEKALQISPNYPSAVEALRRLKGN